MGSSVRTSWGFVFGIMSQKPLHLSHIFLLCKMAHIKHSRHINYCVEFQMRTTKTSGMAWLCLDHSNTWIKWIVNLLWFEGYPWVKPFSILSEGKYLGIMKIFAVISKVWIENCYELIYILKNLSHCICKLIFICNL